MSDRICAHHEDRPAIAVCSACGADICAKCHRSSLVGYAICTTCERKIRSAFQTEWEAAETVGQQLAAFGSTLWSVVWSARTFYGRMPALGSWTKPAAFGVLCYTIGAIASFAWNWMYVPEFHTFVEEYAATADLSTRTALILLLFAVPIAAPLAFAVHTFMLWAALRLVGTDAPWRVVTRISGYAGAAYLFQLMPPIADIPIGYMLAVVWLVNVELIGVRRFFPSLGMWKSMLAVFLPFLALTLVGI